jgi:SAM-dependent methyltransferase
MLLQLDEAIVFQPDVRVRVLDPAGEESPGSIGLHASGVFPGWLPRGEYRLSCGLEGLELPAGALRLEVSVDSAAGGQRVTLAEESLSIESPAATAARGLQQPAWSIQSAGGTVPVEKLAWNRGHEDWFFRHFDHAALVVIELLLKNHPALKGRILDVGCGDGITDLGMFLRLRPEELVGIDPYRGFERLPGVLEANHLPVDVLDEPGLKFLAEDGNSIPYPDDYFDVVVSWGSLEHIAGGYEQTLREIRRVLRKDGLLFVHPGLYFGALGNHLGEFFDDPFIHLKLPEDQLREAVLNTRPQLIDRAGHDADPAQYWQWYKELNPIRVSDFERELRELGFEPWRVALRSSDVVEYTPELQKHSMQDLATAELYLSAWNRK